jgi:hypothetical protein
VKYPLRQDSKWRMFAWQVQKDSRIEEQAAGHTVEVGGRAAISRETFDSKQDTKESKRPRPSKNFPVSTSLGKACPAIRQRLFVRLDNKSSQETVIGLFLFAACRSEVVNFFLAVPQPLENFALLASFLIDAQLLEPLLFRFHEFALQQLLGFGGTGVSQGRELKSGAGGSRDQFLGSNASHIPSRIFPLFNLRSESSYGRGNRQQTLLFLALETLSQAQDGLKWVAEGHKKLHRQPLKFLQGLGEWRNISFPLL